MPLVVEGHLPSHRSLLAAVRRTGTLPLAAPRIPAVIVPAARTAENVRHAARAAARAARRLVLLCSHETDAVAAREEAVKALPEQRVVVAQVPPGWNLPRLDLAADGAELARHRTLDTSVKRNAGLALAVLCGWERVLFLDDDVRGLTRRPVRRMRRAIGPGLPELRAAGWVCDDYPDNSVVCHGLRAAGGEQDTFIGGGCLATRVDVDVPHFPLMYNEDWLFMFGLLSRRQRSIGLVGALRQTRYDPFADPEAAYRQECGDLLAEGLFRLLHQRRLTGTVLEPATRAGYWRAELGRRGRLIDTVVDALVDADEPAAVRALGRARDAHAELTHQVEALADWVRLWHADGRIWSRYLRRLRRTTAGPMSVEDGLRRLDLKVV